MENIQYVYIIKTREFVRSGENIFKIGKTTQNNDTRFKQYPKGSVLMYQTICENCHECEKKIIDKFKNKFIQRREFGNEYFEGNLKMMIITICDIILCKNELNPICEIHKQEVEINNYKNNLKNCEDKFEQITNEYIEEKYRLTERCGEFKNKCVNLEKKSEFQINLINRLIKYDYNLKLDYNRLSKNPNIDLEIIKKNPNKSWDYEYLSKHPNITWEMVKNNPDKNWNYKYLSKNSNITWDIVRDNPDKSWNYRYLSENHNVTWDIVKDNPDKNWSYLGLSANPNITIEIANLNPDNRWDYKMIRYPRNIIREITKTNYNLVSFDDIRCKYLDELKIKYYSKLIKMCPNDLIKHFKSYKEQFIEYNNLYYDGNNEMNGMDEFNQHYRPHERIITELNKINTRRKKVVVDMGCGLAKIAEHFKNDRRFEFINYDHVSTAENIIECDISCMPLEEHSVEICIMSMALWGSNRNDYVREAYRVLETGGKLYIIDSTKTCSTTDDNGLIAEGMEGIKLKNILIETGFQIIYQCVDKWVTFICEK